MKEKNTTITRADDELQGLDNGHASVSTKPTARAVFIPYPKAFEILKKRHGATHEDMVAWVFYGPDYVGLLAYLHTELAEPWQFSYSAYAGNDKVDSFFDYFSLLMDCNFCKEEIENFQPKEHYMRGEVLIERWSKYPDIHSRAYILGKIKESKLMPFHPICGLTEPTRSARRPLPPIETALFAISEIEEIEKSDFGIQFGADNKQPGHLNHDQKMQLRANEIAAEVKMDTKRVPTKNEVAKKLAAELGKNTDTVMRRIRKKW